MEEDILKTIQRLQDSVNNLEQTGSCQVDAECASSFKELVQVRREMASSSILVLMNSLIPINAGKPGPIKSIYITY